MPDHAPESGRASNGADVRIAAVASAHPPLRLPQAEAAELLADRHAEPRRVRALANRSEIACRAIAAPVEQLLGLRSIAERNGIYRAVAPALARTVAREVGTARALNALVTTSCTGYHLPGWGAALVEDLGLPLDIFRLPITESGCAGGVVALQAAANAIRGREAGSALAVSVELCSLSLHLDAADGNLKSALLFGDGAGAARLETGPGDGLRILGASSTLIPGTSHLLGFELRDSGFYPVLERELVQVLPAATGPAVARLLGAGGVAPGDVAAWLLHPGSAGILGALERSLALPEGSTRWSWDSMRANGNTSSAAIFDVLRRYLDDGPASGEYAVIAAFGPGVAIEMLLVQRC